jgi:putative membrane protein
MFHDGNYMIGMHGLWWLFWVLLIGAALMFTWWRPGRSGDGSRETPLEVLRRRLAVGEISPTEFEERKKLLERTPQG